MQKCSVLLTTSIPSSKERGSVPIVYAKQIISFSFLSNATDYNKIQVLCDMFAYKIHRVIKNTNCIIKCH